MARTAAKKASPPPSSGKKSKSKDYTSDGVEDNDVFLLPIPDYYIMIALTVLAFAVRVFRISQPTSVVFDEVQYVQRAHAYHCHQLDQASC